MLLHTLVCAILGAKVECGGPIVTMKDQRSTVSECTLLRAFDSPKVFAKRAACTGALRYQIMLDRLHIGREAVTTNNLMCMRATNKPRVDEGIQTFDCKL